MPKANKEGIITKRNRAMNQQARELGMPLPFPKLEPKKPKPKPKPKETKAKSKPRKKFLGLF